MVFSRAGGVPTLSQDGNFCPVMGVVGDSQAAHTRHGPASPFMIRHFGRDTVLGTRQEPGAHARQLDFGKAESNNPVPRFSFLANGASTGT